MALNRLWNLGLLCIGILFNRWLVETAVMRITGQTQEPTQPPTEEKRPTFKPMPIPGGKRKRVRRY